MNKELQQDIGTAAVAFTENHKKSIAAGTCIFFNLLGFLHFVGSPGLSRNAVINAVSWLIMCS